MYEVHLSVRAQRFIDKLDNSVKKRIEERLKILKNNPIPSDSKFIGRENIQIENRRLQGTLQGKRKREDYSYI